MKPNAAAGRMPLYWNVNQAFVWSISVVALLGMPLFTEMYFYCLGSLPSILSDGDVMQCIPIETLLSDLPTPVSGWRKAPAIQPREIRTDDHATSHSSMLPAVSLMVAEDRICKVGTVPTRSKPDTNIYFTRTLGSKAFPRAHSLSLAHLLFSGREKVPHRDRPKLVELSLWPEEDDNHKYAVADIKGPFRGTQARLSIWHPHVEENEFSLAQVWLSSIDLNGRMHSIEAGWQIYPELYTDLRPRLFVYWTADDYGTTGCYNLHCPGFVQVSNNWLLGGSFAELSTLNSEHQVEIKIHIFKDRGTGDWWLQLNDENVGYWPKSIFGAGAFTDTNTRIDWGGEISHRRGFYTKTEMGNGNHPAFSGLMKVAYVRNIKVVNYHDYLQDPPRPVPRSTYSGCCNLVVQEKGGGNRSLESSWGTYAYFGGSGFNPECVQLSPRGVHAGSYPSPYLKRKITVRSRLAT